jgi:uncharacterized protein (TIGR02118 family)
MSAAYLVIYEGEPEDPRAFIDYYVEHHLPIIWTWPKIRTIELELGRDGQDPSSTTGGVFMVARFLFDSLEDLRVALRSPRSSRSRPHLRPENRGARSASRGAWPRGRSTGTSGRS